MRLDPDAPPQMVDIGLRRLGVGESAEIIKLSTEFAKDHGSSNPVAGDASFELGQRAYTVLYAAVDPEHPNPESVDARFFASIDELLEKKDDGPRLIGRDGISFLFEAQELWESECSPQLSKLSEAEANKLVVEVAESEDPKVYENMQPALRWSCMRFMARRLVTLERLRSLSGSTSTTNSEQNTPNTSPSEAGS